MPADALIALCIFVLLALLIYWPWQWICTDFARQIIFESRDAIFDIAAEGDLDFRSDEYKAIRSSLERSIRFAHTLTLPRFLWYFVAVPTTGKSKLSSAVLAIKNDEVRARVEKHVHHAQNSMLIMMFVKSPAFLLLLPIAIITLGWTVLFSQAKSEAKKLTNLAGDAIQSDAFLTDDRKAA